MRPETVAAVDARDRGRCLRCGKDGGVFGISRHHRLPRGMGGANREHANRLSNVVTLCGSGVTGCHGWVESHRAEARETGWLVPSWADPAEVPMVNLRGRVFCLADG